MSMCVVLGRHSQTGPGVVVQSRKARPRDASNRCALLALRDKTNADRPSARGAAKVRYRYTRERRALRIPFLTLKSKKSGLFGLLVGVDA